MNPEINFYQVDETIGKSLAPLVVKILEEKKRVLIFAKDENLIKEIDSNLWSFGRSKFIAHVTIFDDEFDFARQVALITNKEENLNKANYLIFIDDVAPDFLNVFERVFHFFAEGKASTKFKPTNSYKKQQGKWVKN